MNIDIARELRDAGIRTASVWSYCPTCKKDASECRTAKLHVKAYETQLPDPTTDELIDELGGEFYSLTYAHSAWHASAITALKRGSRLRHDTRSKDRQEALALLLMKVRSVIVEEVENDEFEEEDTDDDA